MLSNPYILMLVCENLQRNAYLYVKSVTSERGKHIQICLKGVFESFEGLGIQHSLYMPVGHLASILVLALVIDMIKINFLLCL